MRRDNRHPDDGSARGDALHLARSEVDPLDMPTETSLDLEEADDESDLLQTAELDAFVQHDDVDPFPPARSEAALEARAGPGPLAPDSGGLRLEGLDAWRSVEQASMAADPVSLGADDVAELLGGEAEKVLAERSGLKARADLVDDPNRPTMLVFCKAGEQLPSYLEPADELPRFALGRRRALARFGAEQEDDARSKRDLPGFGIEDHLAPFVRAPLPAFLLDELPKAAVRARMMSLPAFRIEDTSTHDPTSSWAAWQPEHRGRCGSHRKRRR